MEIAPPQLEAGEIFVPIEEPERSRVLDCYGGLYQYELFVIKGQTYAVERHPYPERYWMGAIAECAQRLGDFTREPLIHENHIQDDICTWEIPPWNRRAFAEEWCLLTPAYQSSYTCYYVESEVRAIAKKYGGGCSVCGKDFRKWANDPDQDDVSRTCSPICARKYYRTLVGQLTRERRQKDLLKQAHEALKEVRSMLRGPEPQKGGSDEAKGKSRSKAGGTSSKCSAALSGGGQ